MEEPSWAYWLLRLWGRMAVELYFVDVQVHGLDKAPPGPVIFAANHPNSIMDGIILGSVLHRPVHYIAKSVLFKNPLAAAVFNAGGVIPIYRQHDDPDNTGQNQDSFRRVYEVLEAGGCIGIFPEGENAPREDKVRDLRTGVARMALGAEERQDFNLGVHIVPVGIVFDDRNRFLSGALLRFADPIAAADFQNHDDPVHALTDAVQESLRQAAGHIESERDRALVDQIVELYGPQIEALTDPQEVTLDMVDQLRSLGDEKQDLERSFATRAEVAKAVEQLSRTDPQLVHRVRGVLRRYHDHLSQVAIRNEIVAGSGDTLSLRLEAMRMTSYAVIWGIPAAWGLFHNAIPFVLTRSFAAMAPDEAMEAFYKMGIGAVLYTTTYTIVASSWRAAGMTWPTVALLAFTLPIAGFLAHRYLRQMLRYRDRILTRVMFLSRRSLTWTLEREHAGVLDVLDTFWGRWVRSRDHGAGSESA